MPKLHNPDPQESFGSYLPRSMIKRINAQMLDEQTMKVKHGERSKISRELWGKWLKAKEKKL